MKWNILGLRFDNLNMEEAVAAGEQLLDGDHPGVVVTPNAEIAYEACRDSAFRELLNSADLMLPDGSGVVLAAKILKKPLKSKVAGIDFATNMLSVFARRGTKLYLLGSKPGIAEAAAEKMKQKAPGLQICGTADGYFKDEAPVIEAINASGAEALFVCLGAPKQEKFMAAHAGELKTVRLMAGLGGSLDGFAGTVKRAPKWMIRLQLEWLYRLIKEPRRIGRMMRLPKYVILAWKARIKGGSKWES
ncbi:MAG: WecB/TagA/CpsF family glycosyltransferase [Oscillospiraceae bacterium]|nr:WecB/TagA/CpsF family glycosyltransferase [Oscillospiraceae bacterium]MBQ2154715.1 WecB/TagA/CpsF family glycosyltransferase [Oscillospiraceae bacterium]